MDFWDTLNANVSSMYMLRQFLFSNCLLYTDENLSHVLLLWLQKVLSTQEPFYKLNIILWNKLERQSGSKNTVSRKHSFELENEEDNVKDADMPKADTDADDKDDVEFKINK